MHIIRLYFHNHTSLLFIISSVREKPKVQKTIDLRAQLLFLGVWFWTTTQMGLSKCAWTTQSVLSQTFLPYGTPNFLHESHNKELQALLLGISSPRRPPWKAFRGGVRSETGWTSACNQEPLWWGREELRLRSARNCQQTNYKAGPRRGWTARPVILMPFARDSFWDSKEIYLELGVIMCLKVLWRTNMKQSKEWLFWRKTSRKEWSGINQWSPLRSHPSW